MEVHGGKDKPCIFVFASHTMSDQANRWGVMEFEVFAFVFCVKNLALLGQLFTVRTDHKNLVYLKFDHTLNAIAD